MDKYIADTLNTCLKCGKPLSAEGSQLCCKCNNFEDVPHLLSTRRQRQYQAAIDKEIERCKNVYGN